MHQYQGKQSKRKTQNHKIQMEKETRDNVFAR